jgi:hypothetical protein
VTDRDAAETVDVGEYCRRVEDYLTRVSGGHLVRIVGPGFELVRGWADAGVPLSAVYRGIDIKAARHQAGQAKRPLRIEFCEADVREVYDDWRRAVGLGSRADALPAAEGSSEPSADAPPERRRGSLTRQLDRAVEQVGRLAGRLELSEALRAAAAAWLGELVALRDEARHARGLARDDLAARIKALDERIEADARASAAPALVAELVEDAQVELAPYRARLSPDAWRRAVAITADRLLRDRLSIPRV